MSLNKSRFKVQLVFHNDLVFWKATVYLLVCNTTSGKHMQLFFFDLDLVTVEVYDHISRFPMAVCIRRFSKNTLAQRAHYCQCSLTARHDLTTYTFSLLMYKIIELSKIIAPLSIRSGLMAGRYKHLQRPYMYGIQNITSWFYFNCKQFLDVKNYQYTSFLGFSLELWNHHFC